MNFGERIRVLDHQRSKIYKEGCRLASFVIWLQEEKKIQGMPDELLKIARRIKAIDVGYSNLHMELLDALDKDMEELSIKLGNKGVR